MLATGARGRRIVVLYACRNGHRLGFETMRSAAIAMVVQRWLDLSYMDSDDTARGLGLRLMTTAMECGV